MRCSRAGTAPLVAFLDRTRHSSCRSARNTRWVTSTATWRKRSEHVLAEEQRRRVTERTRRPVTPSSTTAAASPYGHGRSRRCATTGPRPVPRRRPARRAPWSPAPRPPDRWSPTRVRTISSATSSLLATVPTLLWAMEKSSNRGSAAPAYASTRVLTTEAMWSLPIDAAVQPLPTHVRVGLVQFPDRGGLGDRHVVEHPERTDDDTGEQQTAHVDVRIETVDQAGVVVGVAAQVRPADEQRAQQPDQQQGDQ
ncbi:hypothetical protein SCALM49S_00986 [Streptomyces californicus]